MSSRPVYPVDRDVFYETIGPIQARLGKLETALAARSESEDTQRSEASHHNNNDRTMSEREELEDLIDEVRPSVAALLSCHPVDEEGSMVSVPRHLIHDVVGSFAFIRRALSRLPKGNGEMVCGVDVSELVEAARAAAQALDDWSICIAPEEFPNEAVSKTRARIGEFGRLGYIANTVTPLRAALASLPDPLPTVESIRAEERERLAPHLHTAIAVITEMLEREGISDPETFPPLVEIRAAWLRSEKDTTQDKAD